MSAQQKALSILKINIALSQLSSDILRYIAGFVDGEGCINVYIRPSPHHALKFALNFHFSVSQHVNNSLVVYKINQWFGNVGSIKKHGSENAYEYVVEDRDVVYQIVKALLPYLIVKRPQATLLMHVYSQYRMPMSQYDFLKVCAQVDRFWFLNGWRGQRYWCTRRVKERFAEMSTTTRSVKRTSKRNTAVKTKGVLTS